MYLRFVELLFFVSPSRSQLEHCNFANYYGNGMVRQSTPVTKYECTPICIVCAIVHTIYICSQSLE